MSLPKAQTAPRHQVAHEEGVLRSKRVPFFVAHPSKKIIITIDGPAGTGKSSVAQELARRLGLDFLDTGAMYRAAAALVIDKHLDLKDIERTVEVVADADLHFDWKATPPTILAWFEPIDGRIRDADVTGIVSDVAAIAPLREHMVRKQRIIWNQHPRLVTEGRDQGSVAFPQADVKFFLDASPEVRARRRAAQLADQGRDVDLGQLVREIQQRDGLDSTREVGPLICPDDAFRVDTSNLSFEEVLSRLEQHVREKIGPI